MPTSALPAQHRQYQSRHRVPAEGPPFAATQKDGPSLASLEHLIAGVYFSDRDVYNALTHNNEAIRFAAKPGKTTFWPTVTAPAPIFTTNSMISKKPMIITANT
jgi:hypothetical protein